MAALKSLCGGYQQPIKRHLEAVRIWRQSSIARRAVSAGCAADTARLAVVITHRLIRKALMHRIANRLLRERKA